jgi:hypothetical protein
VALRNLDAMHFKSATEEILIYYENRDNAFDPMKTILRSMVHQPERPYAEGNPYAQEVI